MELVSIPPGIPAWALKLTEPTERSLEHMTWQRLRNLVVRKMLTIAKTASPEPSALAQHHVPANFSVVLISLTCCNYGSGTGKLADRWRQAAGGGGHASPLVQPRFTAQVPRKLSECLTLLQPCHAVCY